MRHLQAVQNQCSILSILGKPLRIHSDLQITIGYCFEIFAGESYEQDKSLAYSHLISHDGRLVLCFNYYRTKRRQRQFGNLEKLFAKWNSNDRDTQQASDQEIANGEFQS